MGTYAKMFMMLLAAVVSAIVAALTGDNHVDPVEWVNVAIAGVAAAAVFAAPNVPGSNYTKSVLAVLAAVLTLLANLILGGLTVSEVLQLIVAALGALGVYAVPNSFAGRRKTSYRDDNLGNTPRTA